MSLLPEELVREFFEHLTRPRIWLGHKELDKIVGPLYGGKWIHAVVYPPVDRFALTAKIAASIVRQGRAIALVCQNVPAEIIKNKLRKLFGIQIFPANFLEFYHNICLEKFEEIAAGNCNLQLIIVDEFDALKPSAKKYSKNEEVMVKAKTIKQAAIRYSVDVLTFNSCTHPFHDYVHWNADVILGLHQFTYPTLNFIEVVKNREGPAPMEIKCKL